MERPPSVNEAMWAQMGPAVQKVVHGMWQERQKAEQLAEERAEEARKEGEEKGRQEGEEKGRKEGRKEGREEGEKIGEQRATKRIRDQATTMLTSFLPSPKRRRQGHDAAHAARLLLARVAQRISQTFVLSARLQKVQARVEAKTAEAEALINSSLDAAETALRRAVDRRRGQLLFAVRLVAERQLSMLEQVRA